MKNLLSSIALASMFLVTPAHAWDIDKMNAQIEDTNVIVGGVCSGTIISKAQRLVLTAYHCVEQQFTEVSEKVVDPKTSEIKEVTKRVLVPLQITTNKVRNFEVIETTQHTAKIVASDSDNDIVLLQVTDVDFAPAAEVKLASDSYQYKRGLRVFAVGNPGIAFDNSVTEGIISSPQRTVEIDGKSLKMFQNSATIIGGNSGGAILNDDGDLIGTVSVGMRGASIGFAVPISFTKAMIKATSFASILDANH